MSSITIANLNKADVLAALYNASKPLGMGFMAYDPKPMTRDEAEILLKERTRFDYLKGRVMKIDLAGDMLDSTRYNRDNGDGCAERIIGELAKTSDVNTADIQATHHSGTVQSAEHVKAHIGDEDRPNEQLDDGTTIIHLGLSDVAEHLAPVVDDILKTEETDHD